MSSLPERIRLALKVREMTAEALEYSAGTAGGSVSRLVHPRGKTQNPGAQTMARLAAALDVSADWLIHGAGDPPKPRPEKVPAGLVVLLTEKSLRTMSDRGWWAWHSLPRGRTHRPPGIERLEREHGLPRDRLKQLFEGAKVGVARRDLHMYAKALGTTAEWLEHGDGVAPTPTGPVPPRPDRYPPAALVHDLGRSVELIASAWQFTGAELGLMKHMAPPNMTPEEAERLAARARGIIWRAQRQLEIAAARAFRAPQAPTSTGTRREVGARR